MGRRDDHGGARRESTHGTSIKQANALYDPALQVPLEDMRHAYFVLSRMLEGGELLARTEWALLAQGKAVLAVSIKAAELRNSAR